MLVRIYNNKANEFRYFNISNWLLPDEQEQVINYFKAYYGNISYCANLRDIKGQPVFTDDYVSVVVERPAPTELQIFDMKNLLESPSHVETYQVRIIGVVEKYDEKFIVNCGGFKLTLTPYLKPRVIGNRFITELPNEESKILGTPEQEYYLYYEIIKE